MEKVFSGDSDQALIFTYSTNLFWNIDQKQIAIDLSGNGQINRMDHNIFMQENIDFKSNDLNQSQQFWGNIDLVQINNLLSIRFNQLETNQSVNFERIINKWIQIELNRNLDLNQYLLGNFLMNYFNINQKTAIEIMHNFFTTNTLNFRLISKSKFSKYQFAYNKISAYYFFKNVAHILDLNHENNGWLRELEKWKKIIYNHLKITGRIYLNNQDFPQKLILFFSYNDQKQSSIIWSLDLNLDNFDQDFDIKLPPPDFIFNNYLLQ
jgi:hypothetical protein